MKKVFVSACLLGENCKYNGGNNLRSELLKKLENCEIIPVCPECFGGLPTPRKPSEIQGVKVVNSEGEDVTAEFEKGALKTLEMAIEHQPDSIYLKQGSPSCGCGVIYDGTFSGTKKQGDGVTAALLKKYGFNVIAID